jgi:hypothetical protein
MKTFVLIHENARNLAKKEIDSIPLDGKMKVEIKKVTSKRSEAQNKLYWMWVTIIANELGYTKIEMHESLVQSLLLPEAKEIHGKMITIWPSTTSLKVGEFAEFLNDIDVFASSDLGIVLPQPADEYYLAVGNR